MFKGSTKYKKNSFVDSAMSSLLKSKKVSNFVCLRSLCTNVNSFNIGIDGEFGDKGESGEDGQPGM